MKKFIIIYPLVLIYSVMILKSCKPASAFKLDFNPVAGKNKLDTPAGIRTIRSTQNEITFHGFEIPCNGAAVVFKVKNLSGDLGILTINSLYAKNECNLSVRITGLCETCDAGIAQKNIKPGESMTDIFDITGHTDDLIITLNCSGENNSKCVFNLDFSTAVKFDPKRNPPPRPALIKQIISNPEGNAPFTPINPQGNHCTTEPLLLKTIYQDQDKKATPLNLSFSSKPLCDCVPFNVILSADAAGARPIDNASANTNGGIGTATKVKEKRSAGLPALYFWGACAGGRNPPCRGDVIINITAGK